MIPDDFKNRKHTMEFTEIELELQQRYGWTKIELIKESRKYLLKYTSAHYESCKKELSTIEAAWLEKQVNDCFENEDQTTWQSLPGGDMMTVKIYKHGKLMVRLIREKPLKKYYDLQSSLQKLVRYGSLTETEAKKIKG